LYRNDEIVQRILKQWIGRSPRIWICFGRQGVPILSPVIRYPEPIGAESDSRGARARGRSRNLTIETRELFGFDPIVRGREIYKAPTTGSSIRTRVERTVRILAHHAERIRRVHCNPAAVAARLLEPGGLAAITYGAVILATGNEDRVRVRTLGNVIDLRDVKAARSGNERPVAGRRGGLKDTSVRADPDVVCVVRSVCPPREGHAMGVSVNTRSYEGWRRPRRGSGSIRNGAAIEEKIKNIGTCDRVHCRPGEIDDIRRGRIDGKNEVVASLCILPCSHKHVRSGGAAYQIEYSRRTAGQAKKPRILE
jgi:hypothetical protein